MCCSSSNIPVSIVSPVLSSILRIGRDVLVAIIVFSSMIGNATNVILFSPHVLLRAMLLLLYKLHLRMLLLHRVLVGILAVLSV